MSLSHATGLTIGLLLGASCVMGCHHEAKPAANPTFTTNAVVDPTPTPRPLMGPQMASSSISLSSTIREQCGVASIANVNDAPTFYFDQSTVTDDDKQVLAKVAECLTTGPLKGRQLQLVGHADARGTDEYNMALGARRADDVMHYLQGLGVGSGRMSETSRGALDATGTDAQGFMRDRRVDLDVK